MTGFQSPNYTQTPNDLFDELLPEMGLAELKVVLCIIRHTFGYHKDEIKMSIRAIARFTGLNVNSVMEGATKAEAHGLIERNLDGNKTTVWTAIVSVLPTKTPRLSTSDASVLPTKTLLGVKERKKDNKKIDAILFQPNQKELQEQEATRKFERAFGFGELPWRSTKIWDKMTRFVTDIYQHDPQAFGNYIVWRGNGGKYFAMSNKQIRLNPQVFIDTGWAEFESQKSNINERDQEHAL